MHEPRGHLGKLSYRQPKLLPQNATLYIFYIAGKEWLYKLPPVYVRSVPTNVENLISVLLM